MPQTVSTVSDLRKALLTFREAGETVALVPTMGALHRGHLALVEAARRVAKRTVVSIFVNPLQFGPKEDFTKYPRPIEQDLKLLSNTKCDLVYMPSADEMYPKGSSAEIDPGVIGTLLEGTHRPGHFKGVATVVAKLLLQVMPDIALFGEKDYQQLLVIDRMVQDLNIPVHIVGVPTVRENDGLALSSRNAYLSDKERATAPVLSVTLSEAAAAISKGGAIESILKQSHECLTAAGFVVDYLELADAYTLTPLRDRSRAGRLLAAAKLGTTRLIDNVAVDKR
jgi:pantoate--beta-alanine ligase